MAQTPCDLTGLGVVVTRPAHQAAGLCELIDACGGTPIAFPALEIGPPDDFAQAEAELDQLDQFDIAIFISPNAVEFGVKALGGRPLPEGLLLAAVGQGSVKALAARGYRVKVSPEERFDSEALLDLPELRSVSGKRVLIVRGVGGRALLGDTLAARGAKVHYAEVYQRRLPAIDPKPLLAQWQRVDVFVATSGEILDNLIRLLDSAEDAVLREIPLLVVSDRIRSKAEKLGFAQVLLSPGAQDETVVATLCNWWQRQRL